MNDVTPAKPFDLNTASAEALTAQFPELGLFSAEDIVAWCQKNGPLRDKGTLTDLGIRDDVAARIAEYIVPAGPPALDESAENSDLIIGGADVTSEPPSTNERATDQAEPTSAGPTERQAFEAGLEAGAAKAVATAGPEETSAAGVDVFSTNAVETGGDVFTSSTEEGAWFEAGKRAEEPTPAFETDDDAPKAAAGAHESGVVSLPGTASEAADQAVPEPPAPSKFEESAATETAEQPLTKPARGARALPILVGLVLLLNIGVIAAVVTMRVEEHKARAPVAALSVDVKELHTQQDEARTQLNETRTQLSETRKRLDKQARELAKTADTVSAAVQRQKDAEREANERSAREARELAGLNARLRRVERTVEDSIYTVEEAVKIIDMVHGQKPTASSHTDGAHHEEPKHAQQSRPTAKLVEKHPHDAKPAHDVKPAHNANPAHDVKPPPHDVKAPPPAPHH